MAETAPRPRDELKKLGLRPAKSRGQNFLKDGGAIQRLSAAILKAAGGEKLLEIGPGLGALTRPLLAAGAEILAVELDRGLAENLKSEGRPGLTVLNRDVLTLEPAEFPGPRFLFGNLPYNISSPALFWFLRHRRIFSGALFMLQKELAERLAAGPGRRAYGRLSVALGLWCRVEKVLSVPAAAFHPRPRVDGAAVLLRPVPREDEPAVSLEALGRFTLVAFGARRQTLLNNLARVYGRDSAARVLADFGLAPGTRAETLAPPVLAALAENFRRLA